MYSQLKNHIRDLLPKRYQVPVKYCYGWFRNELEDEMKLLELLVKRDGQAIDIGGNRGIYAYKLWRLGAKVEVFEPNPECIAVLAAWAASKPDVNIHAVALSNSAGTANLHIPVDSLGVEHDASASIEDVSSISTRDQPVPIQTLDSYLFEDVSLIKIDVEGHEYSVIEGAEATLASSRPALLVEIEQRHNGRPVGEVFEKIVSFGYQGFFLMENRLTELEHFDVTRHQSIENFGGSKGLYINNFLFLHGSRLAAGEYGALLDDWPLK